MSSQPIAILGIPVFNYTLEELTQEAMAIVEKKGKEETYYLCLLNFRLLTEMHSWNGFSVRHQELLNIARKCGLAIGQGLPISFLCYLLGSPLKDTIKPSALVLQLVDLLGKKQKSIFLFGGQEKILKETAIKFHDLAPGIKIVGISRPTTIYSEGEVLIHSLEKMALILEKISESNADLLAINLTGPQRKIWFGREKKRLKVPLALGISEALPDILGKPIPISLKDRLTSWIESIYTFIKGCYIALPLVVYHNINRLICKLFFNHRNSLQRDTYLFLSPSQTVAVIKLQPLIDDSNVLFLKQQVEESLSQDVQVLDFRGVRHLQPEGLYMLIDLWQTMQKQNKKFYGLGIHKDLELFLKLHRVWDLIQEQVCQTPEALIERIKQPGKPNTLYDAIHQRGNQVTVSFFGPLDDRLDWNNYLEHLTPIIAQKDCLLDFSLCTYIDHIGFIFLLKLRKAVLQQGKQIKITQLSRPLKRQFRLSKLWHLFEQDRS